MTRRILALVLTLLPVGWIAPAVADTYHDVNCYCDPKTEGQPIRVGQDTNIACGCQQSFTLGKLATKEFRFFCKSPNAQAPQAVAIGELDTPTTCTAGMPWGQVSAKVDTTKYYWSKSCTNWSTVSTDELKLSVLCEIK